MCVVQRVHLRVVLVGSYILHLGVHVVLLFWRCCTSYCNMPSYSSLYVLKNIPPQIKFCGTKKPFKKKKSNFVRFALLKKCSEPIGYPENCAYYDIRSRTAITAPLPTGTARSAPSLRMRFCKRQNSARRFSAVSSAQRPRCLRIFSAEL